MSCLHHTERHTPCFKAAEFGWKWKVHLSCIEAIGPVWWSINIRTPVFLGLSCPLSPSVVNESQAGTRQTLTDPTYNRTSPEQSFVRNVMKFPHICPVPGLRDKAAFPFSEKVRERQICRSLAWAALNVTLGKQVHWLTVSSARLV